ncbi:MAG: hypothetical protein Phyf2KO_19670 [Phycisphaerales bacterium]
MIEPDLLQALLTTVEMKDAATAAHTWRVTLYTRALAEVFGVQGERLRLITLGAALHDIGKIDIDDAILRKPGKLTDAEFEEIKRHPVLGVSRLEAMGITEPELLSMVRSHHERWDGLGYPDGLVGEAIPPAARYFAVIDTFDALTSIRPYRSEIGDAAAREAVRELVRGSGTRYFPDAVEAFKQMQSRGELDWIMHYFNDGVDVPGFSEIEHLDDRVRELRDER